MNNYEKSEEHITVKSARNEFTKILINDILYFKADGNYTHIKLTTEDTITICKNLKHTLEDIESDLFVKINRGLVVNRSLITKLKTGKKSSIKLANGQEFQNSKKYQAELKQVLFTY